MRYGILGDIHSNPSALDAVLSSLAREKVDRLFSVGDIVGYGAAPTECVSRILEVGAAAVAGNHDLAAVDRIPVDTFHPIAREAVLWTRRSLDARSAEYLSRLPLLLEEGSLTVAHGSIDRPEAFDYIQSAPDAQASLARLRTRIGFVGHSHVPVSYLCREGDPVRLWYTFEPEISLSGCARALVNVGSIGQPRDGDPRAAYAVYDDVADKVWIRRVPYDVEEEVGRIRGAGLPPVLGERLRLGT